MCYRKKKVALHCIALDLDDLITKLGEEAGAGCFEKPELAPIDYHFKVNAPPL